MPTSTSWRKSTFSDGGQSNCLEVAFAETGAAVRDSKNATGPKIALSATAWRGFVGVVAASVGGRS
jgi:hypothetical protein